MPFNPREAGWLVFKTNPVLWVWFLVLLLRCSAGSRVAACSVLPGLPGAGVAVGSVGDPQSGLHLLCEGFLGTGTWGRDTGE